MPVNSRIMYGMITDKIEERTGKQSPWLDSVAKEIEVNSQNADQIKRKTGVSIMNSLVDGNWSKRMFTPVVDQAKCVSCGICQSVCPVDNILVSDNGAKIEDKCENCMSCMHWCPEVAIKFKRRNVRKEQQYHHPDVKLKDIIKSVG